MKTPGFRRVSRSGAWHRDARRFGRSPCRARVGAGRILVLALLIGTVLGGVGVTPVLGTAFQVSGTFRYEDRIWDKNGYTGAVQNLPIRHADVEIVNVGTSAVIGAGATNASGQFNITANATGNVTLYVRVLARTNNSADYHITVSNDAGTVVHSARTDNFANHNPNNNLAIGTWTVFDADGFGVAQAFNILDCVVDGFDWLAQSQALNRYPTASEYIVVRWSTTSNFAGSYYSGQFINISSPVSGDTDGWSDTVILHELGHYVADLFHQDDNTGGQHFLGDSFQDPRLSYGEGYATYYCGEVRERRALVQGTDAHVSLYADLAMPPAVGVPGALEFSYDFETGLLGNGTPLGQIGQANETNITSAMWDLHDGTGTPDESASVDDDAIDGTGSDVWDVLLGYMKNIPLPDIITFEDFVQGWRAVFGPAYLAPELDNILNVLNRMGFEADAQEPDDTPAAAPAATLGSYALVGAGGGVRLNEVELGAEDAVEVYNSSNAAVNLLNWQIQASSNTVTVTFTFPAYTLQPGAFVYVRERGSSTNNTETDLYGGSAFNIPWSNGAPGACALLDASAVARDFVRFDGPGTPSTTPVPPGTGWSGTVASPGGDTTLGRNSTGADTDTAADWSVAPNSATQPNGLAYADHTIFDTGDTDHVRMSLVKDHLYSVRTFALFGAADTFLELLAADGATVLAAHDDRGVTLPESKLTFVAPSTGDFFARVSHVGGLTQYGMYRLRVYEHPQTGVLLAPIGLGAAADHTHLSGDPVTFHWLNGSVYDSVRVEVHDATATVMSATVSGDATSHATTLSQGLYSVQLRGAVGVQTSPLAVERFYAGVFPATFSDNFDGPTGLYAWGAPSPWGLTAGVFSSGPWSATDSPGGNYADNVDVALELDVPVRLGTGGVLGFRHICITEDDYDYGFVEISADDGQTWNALAAYDMGDHASWNDGVASNGDFVQEALPLVGYDNQVVRIRFRLVTDGGVTEDGWYIDSVSIQSDVTAAPELPALVYSLRANEPNPFNPRTTIRYSLSAPEHVDLRIHDLRGRVVRTLVAAQRPAGWHRAVWDGRDDAGRRVASGVYFYRLAAGPFVESRKMLLLK